jgi:extracellular factor (EF) 3-hydroxypalmitic acid methyl ester biosynthesis protein
MMDNAIAAVCRRCEEGMDAGEIEPSMTDFVATLACTRAALDAPEWRVAAATFSAHPVHGLFLNDPYTADAYRKGRGYAGDADTLDFVYRYRGAPPDTTPLGRRLFQITTDVPIACAVRARCRYLGDRIASLRAARPDAIIVSVACGHMRELEGLELPVGGGAIYGLDHDPATIERLTRMHAGAVIARRTSVRRILTHPETVPQADMIYAAGLFDYLDDRTAALLIRRLRARLLPGGLLVLTNLTQRNGEIAYMEAIMDWWMVYRDEADLRGLVRGDAAAVRTCSVMDGRVACLELQA